MLKQKLILRVLLVMISFAFITSSCNKDDDINSKGSLKLEITDAPVDDAAVSGTFITVSKIMINGNEISGFQKTTLDLMSYQNGSTKLLADYEIDAGTYNDITMVLDYDTDAEGNSPGCYVLDASSGAKHKLESESNEILLSHNFEVQENQQSNVIIDFDLRKCVVRDTENDDNYEFATNSELENSIRVVTKSNTGTINGNCEDTVLNNSDKIVVFAYSKGSFNRETEVNGQGASNIEFYNSVTSAAVDANGNYELHFLEQGDYELHFVSYKENSENEMQLNGTLTVDVLNSIDLNSISLTSNANIEVNVLVTGIIPVL